VIAISSRRRRSFVDYGSYDVRLIPNGWIVSDGPARAPVVDVDNTVATSIKMTCTTSRDDESGLRSDGEIRARHAAAAFEMHAAAARTRVAGRPPLRRHAPRRSITANGMARTGMAR
jgi:hypothetical protein